MLRKPIAEPYFSQLASGEKTYEGRLGNKVEEWDLDVGKHMIFFNDVREIEVEIHTLLRCGDFGQAFDILGSALMPGENMTRERVKEIYNELGLTDTETHGVVALGIRIVRRNF